MEKVYVKDLNNYLEKEITFMGFVDTVRDKKWVMFVILRDSTGKIQMTIEKSEEANKELLEIMSNITVDSVIKVKGLLKENSAVKLGGMELIPSSIEVMSRAEALPFDYNNLDGVNIDTRLDYRFLDLRNEKNMLVRQIESCLVGAMRAYLYQEDFTEIHTPKLIGAASESGSEVFEVKYFDRKAYLAQSPQFYKQMAMAAGMSKIFEVAPAFRAENSNTNRHATEFTSFDLEFSYIDSYLDVMDMEENLLIAGLTKVKEVYGEKIKEVFGKEVIVPIKPFPRIKLQDLYQELKERYNFVIPSEDVGDLNAEAEKLAYQYAMEKYNSEFLFITDYAKTKRAFYHMRKDDIPQGYDLIWRGSEITTGAQREHRYDILKAQAQEKGLGEDVKFYLEFFKYGCPPHGGFAVGVDRLTMLLLGLPSVKETQFLFRGPNRLEP
ncbi:MAG: aspartate--tRNA(Asn) ligase [bacterium]|nr:aspartate--tRNA(Asn) ligase [bacterium]